MAGDPLQTISPDGVAEVAAAPADARVFIHSPGGPIQRILISQFMAKMVATDLIFATVAELEADLAHDPATVALVHDDPVALANGWYRKTGAAGAGAWVQFDTLSLATKNAMLAALADAIAAQSAAEAAQALAEAAVTDAQNWAAVAGPGEFNYDTRALAVANVATPPVGAYVGVFNDENYAGARTVYKKTGPAALTLVKNFGKPLEADTAAVLTNKQIALGNNTVTGTLAQFNAACTDADFAPATNANLLGNPTAPTQAVGNNSTRLATTAFVLAQIAQLRQTAPALLDTFDEFAAALGNDPNFAATIMTLLSAKASLTGAETLEGKRIKPRVVAAAATTGTITANSDTADVFRAVGLTGAVTVGVPTGSPTSEQKLILYFDDNGTSRTITWATGAGGFRAAKDVDLPTATTAGKWLRVGCIWNADDGFWDVVAVVVQA